MSDAALSPAVRRDDWPAAQKWFWAVAGGVVCLLFGLATWHRVTAPPRTLNDFVQEWASARNYLAGEPVYQDLRLSVPRHLGVRGPLLLSDNAHPPAAVLVTLPLAHLDYAAALRWWNTASLVALAASLLLLLGRRGLAWSPWYWLPLLAVLLSSNPLAQQILQGQLNLLLLLLLTAAWVLLRNERSLAAGVLIGAAAAVKLFPAFLGLYFLMRRDVRGVLGCALGFALLNGLAVAALGGECFFDYLQIVPRVAAEFQACWSNASLNGYWRKLFDGGGGHVVPLARLPGLAAALTAASCLAVTCIAARQVWRADTARRRDLALAACMLAMVLVSPISWDHYFLMLVPALCVLWAEAPAGRWQRPVLLVLVALLFFLRPRWLWDATIAGDGELVLLPGQTASVALPWQVLTVVSYQFYGLLALFVMACRAGARGSMQDDAAAPSQR